MMPYSLDPAIGAVLGKTPDECEMPRCSSSIKVQAARSSIIRWSREMRMCASCRALFGPHEDVELIWEGAVPVTLTEDEEVHHVRRAA